MSAQPFNPSGRGHGPKPPAIVSFPEDRLPPQNIEAEQGVLGAILLDNDILHDVAPILKVDDFWRDEHQVIYRAIMHLYEQGKPVPSGILRRLSGIAGVELDWLRTGRGEVGLVNRSRLDLTLDEVRRRI